jgi:hypothetical protein
MLQANGDVSDGFENNHLRAQVLMRSDVPVFHQHIDLCLFLR